MKRRTRLYSLPALAVVIVVVIAGVLIHHSSTPSHQSSAAPSAQTASVSALVTRPDLRPPISSIRLSLPGQAPGLIFIAPKKVFGSKQPSGAQQGQEIIDSKGRVRYFKPNVGHLVADDYAVQEYEGKPVLTFWYGNQVNGHGNGYDVIEDDHYHVIATVHAGDGMQADFHEFQLTPQGSALITVDHDTTYHGQKVDEGVIQEIDVKTGKVLTEWKSLDDVPLADSYEPKGIRSSAYYDYIHVNAADLDTDGNILVSARNTWAIYKIQRHTGKLLWTLGGKATDFKIGPGANTGWQHDVRSVGPNLITVFDNGAGDTGAPVVRKYSRVATIRIDPVNKTATLVASQAHPGGLSAGTQGDGQLLPNGDMFIGWGSKGVFSEFTKGGKMLFDARVPQGDDTYRAFRSPWTGIPSGPPSVAAHVSGSRIIVAASWNGSTQVASWRVMTGKTPADLTPAGQGSWKNLETQLTVPARGAHYVAVEALDATGKVLSTSATHTISR
jgi:Arylsulfotransferase (ASST)